MERPLSGACPISNLHQCKGAKVILQKIHKNKYSILL